MVSRFKNNQYYFIAYVVLLLIGFILLGLGSKGDLIILFGNGRTDRLTEVYSVLTMYGEVIAYLCLGALMLFFSFRNALKIALVGLIVLPVVHFLKWLFAYPRPYKYFELQSAELPFAEIEGVEKLMGFNSFPSGHTTGAFALSTIIAVNIKNKKVAALWLIPAVLAGLSRIYLTHHFLEDVVFGSALGVFLAMICDYYFLPHEIKINGRRSLIHRV